MRLLLYEEIFCVNIIRCPMWLNNTVSRRKRYRVYLRLYLPRPLHLTSPRPRLTRPRVPYVPRPIPDVPTSLPSRPQVPSPHTRVPMSPSHFYTQASVINITGLGRTGVRCLATVVFLPKKWTIPPQAPMFQASYFFCFMHFYSPKRSLVWMFIKSACKLSF